MFPRFLMRLPSALSCLTLVFAQSCLNPVGENQQLDGGRADSGTAGLACTASMNTDFADDWVVIDPVDAGHLTSTVRYQTLKPDAGCELLTASVGAGSVAERQVNCTGVGLVSTDDAGVLTIGFDNGSALKWRQRSAVNTMPTLQTGSSVSVSYFQQYQSPCEGRCGVEVDSTVSIRSAVNGIVWASAREHSSFAYEIMREVSGVMPTRSQQCVAQVSYSPGVCEGRQNRFSHDIGQVTLPGGSVQRFSAQGVSFDALWSESQDDSVPTGQPCPNEWAGFETTNVFVLRRVQ